MMIKCKRSSWVKAGGCKRVVYTSMCMSCRQVSVKKYGRPSIRRREASIMSKAYRLADNHPSLHQTTTFPCRRPLLKSPPWLPCHPQTDTQLDNRLTAVSTTTPTCLSVSPHPRPNHLSILILNFPLNSLPHYTTPIFIWNRFKRASWIGKSYTIYIICGALKYKILKTVSKEINTNIVYFLIKCLYRIFV